MMLNKVPSKWLDTEDHLDGTGTLGSEVCQVASPSPSTGLHPQAVQQPPAQQPQASLFSCKGQKCCTLHHSLSTQRRRQLHSACCCQPHQAHSLLEFLTSCSPEAFAQHLSLQYPRTDLIDVTPIIPVSLNAELMHLCVQTS